MHKAFKVLGIVFGLCILLLGGAAGYLYTQQDAIIAGGIDKINEQLKAPVSVEQIDLDLLGGFPRVRIALNNVSIEDPLRKGEFLLQAKYVGLGMNVLSVIQGDYIIEELSLADGSLLLYDNGSFANWELLETENQDESKTLELSLVELVRLQVEYKAPKEGIDYSCYANSALLTGTINDRVALKGRADLIKNVLNLDGETWINDGHLNGSFAFTSDDSTWKITSTEMKVNGLSLSGEIHDQGGNLDLKTGNLLPLLSSLPLLTTEDIQLDVFKSAVQWNGSYEDWEIQLQPSKSAFNYRGIAISDFSSTIKVNWKDVPSISIENISLKTSTGTLTGNALLSGEYPELNAQIAGGSNLSELFAFVEVESLTNPMGFWNGNNLKIRQRFDSWDDFNPVGQTSFEGNLQLKEVSFGISESTIEFEKVEAELVVEQNDIKVERCFLKSGPNNAVVSGVVQNALEGRPQVILRLESPHIDVDPLLFWEFEDDEGSEDDFGFDFQADLYVDQLNLGEFNGKGLRGTVYNRKTTILGRNMRLDGCGGTFRGNWVLAEETEGSRFWSKASCTTIELDQLLKSFDSFDIEDLDESNLKGSANATAEMTFYFDSEWLVQSQKTSIDVQAEVRNGALRNYSPLQELSSFVDRDELSRIDFPYLKGPFQIRGDTLIIPETQVNNSAINFWVNGWQNLETDAIEYSIRIGLKDLALRGKNSNRDLGQWVAEAETENQPYMRLLVGCNLDDPCISLDKKQIRTSLKSTLKQEKEDLKTLFKRDEKEDEENDLNKGNFELLWPESDSLSIHITP
ncbi:MAG: AsmA-like C-terminal region-containing protein [Schleiferiaceae bacterium]